jgi:ATP-dependent Clp protease ATP-binding subunit ClpX
MLEVNTKNILFIAGGAFVGLKEIIGKRMKGSSIGFGATVVGGNKEGDLADINPDDLTKFGMIPEFVGRFTTTVSIESLTKEQLIHVLTDVKNSYISQYQYLFKLDDIDLEFADTALDQLATNTINLKIGARGLHTEIERVLMPHMFNIKKYKHNNIKKINISQEQVLKPQSLL